MIAVSVYTPSVSAALQCVLFVKLSGAIPAGSEGNQVVMSACQKVEENLQRLQHEPLCDNRSLNLVLNCLNLDYSYGDALASLWLGPLSKGVNCVIIAAGATKTSIASLVAISVNVAIAENEVDALQLLTL